MGSRTVDVLADVGHERVKQDAKWGRSDHADGTHANYMSKAEELKSLATEQAMQNNITWNTILQEEVFEALSTGEPDILRAELVQVAAVAVAWIEALDARQAEYDELHPSVDEDLDPADGG